MLLQTVYPINVDPLDAYGGLSLRFPLKTNIQLNKLTQS